MEKTLTKTAAAVAFGVSRSSLYYKPLQEAKDRTLRDEIITILGDHPAYGYRRIALHLGINKKRAQRVMQKYGLHPTIRRKQPKYARKTSVSGIPNRTKNLTPIAPNTIWSGDFTELTFQGRKIYLATVIDRYTRELIAWQLGFHHTTRLIIDVLEEAVRKRECVSSIFHSDQGSEHTSHACIEWLVSHRILPSHSPKSSPWRNGHQESFFNTFKLEFGKPSRHKTIQLLTEAIGRYIHYYNTRLIHSALRMPPRTFCDREREKYEKPRTESV
jgi:transposase InsO family protein